MCEVHTFWASHPYAAHTPHMGTRWRRSTCSHWVIKYPQNASRRVCLARNFIVRSPCFYRLGQFGWMGLLHPEYKPDSAPSARYIWTKHTCGFYGSSSWGAGRMRKAELHFGWRADSCRVLWATWFLGRFSTSSRRNEPRRDERLSAAKWASGEHSVPISREPETWRGCFCGRLAGVGVSSMCRSFGSSNCPCGICPQERLSVGELKLLVVYNTGERLRTRVPDLFEHQFFFN